jgi:pimeloyl-ACP methyl ester carboxylesterase
MQANLKRTRYKTRHVGDVEVFYREAGSADAPVILLLHGFPTASHMFRDLIPLLADRYRLIAPDLPGFGQTIRDFLGRVLPMENRSGGVLPMFAT